MFEILSIWPVSVLKQIRKIHSSLAWSQIINAELIIVLDWRLDAGVCQVPAKSIFSIPVCTEIYTEKKKKALTN